MKFDAKSSTKYQQIMEAAVTFFALDKDNATETDVHDAFDKQKEPFAKQLETARTEAVTDLQKQFDQFKEESKGSAEKVADLQKQFDTMKTDIETKDARILELTKEVAKGTEAVESLKRQHKTETDKLAGELAKNRAGEEMEVDEAGDAHDAGKKEKSSGPKVVVAKSDALKNLAKKRVQ